MWTQVELEGGSESNAGGFAIHFDLGGHADFAEVEYHVLIDFVAGEVDFLGIDPNARIGRQRIIRPWPGLQMTAFERQRNRLREGESRLTDMARFGMEGEAMFSATFIPQGWSPICPFTFAVGHAESLALFVGVRKQLPPFGVKKLAAECLVSVRLVVRCA